MSSRTAVYNQRVQMKTLQVVDSAGFNNAPLVGYIIRAPPAAAIFE